MDIVELLVETARRRASDLILTAGSPPVLRVNGALEMMETRLLSAEDVKRCAYSLLSRDQVARFEKELELDFSVTVDERYRFRANVYRQRGKTAVAFRLIPLEIPDFKELGLPKKLEEICRRANGLFLITGATGMGKSTTLAAMVDHINTHRRTHIITIEDPIEFVHLNKQSVVDQREVGTDTMSFHTALKFALRQSPDVIVVGEMRDLETISAALTAAETGHLVLATLHTRNGPQTVDRIVDSFPAHQQNQVREQLANSLIGVLSQRLFPRADGGGRVLATELLLNNYAVANLIRERKVHQLPGVMETGQKVGMYTFDMSIKALLLRRLVKKEDVEGFMTRSSLNAHGTGRF